MFPYRLPLFLRLGVIHARAVNFHLRARPFERRKISHKRRPNVANRICKGRRVSAERCPNIANPICERRKISPERRAIIVSRISKRRKMSPELRPNAANRLASVENHARAANDGYQNVVRTTPRGRASAPARNGLQCRKPIFGRASAPALRCARAAKKKRCIFGHAKRALFSEAGLR